MYKGHFFQPLKGGTSPEYIPNKSGKFAVEVAVVCDVAVMICRIRVGYSGG